MSSVKCQMLYIEYCIIYDIVCQMSNVKCRMLYIECWVIIRLPHWLYTGVQYFCNIRICNLQFIFRKHSAKCWQCWLCTTASSSQQPLQASACPSSQTTGRYFSFFLFAKRKFSSCFAKKEAPVCPSSQTTGMYFSFSILLFCRSVTSFNMTDATYMVSWAGKFLTTELVAPHFTMSRWHGR